MAEESALLAALPDTAFRAMLLFMRLGAAVMLFPGLGEQEVPASFRLAVGLALTLLLFPLLAPALPPAPDDAAEALRLIALETVIGLWLGGLARLTAMAMTMAGQAIALLMGLAQALVPDPHLGGFGTAPARLFTLAAALLVLMSGLYLLPLRALVESYAVLPVGDPFPAGLGAQELVAVAAASFALALRLAAPFLLAALVLQTAIGLLARLAPQLQVYFIALPGQTLAALVLLALLFAPLLAAFAEGARSAFLALPGLR